MGNAGRALLVVLTACGARSGLPAADAGAEAHADDDAHAGPDSSTDCQSSGNECPKPWLLERCVDGKIDATDCDAACKGNAPAFGDLCRGHPAMTGQCDSAGATCVCWCDDSFDFCTEDTAWYARAGVTFSIDCKDYCGGTCDRSVGACVCP